MPTSEVHGAKNRGYVWPSPGVTGIRRGLQTGHNAIDIATPTGTNLVATKSGTVAELYNGCYHYSKGAEDANHNYGFGNGLLL